MRPKVALRSCQMARKPLVRPEKGSLFLFQTVANRILRLASGRTGNEGGLAMRRIRTLALPLAAVVVAFFGSGLTASAGDTGSAGPIRIGFGSPGVVRRP